MRRTTRLFEIIQLLRAGTRPMTAASIAATFEVTPRTIYRDIGSLQATGVPILGEAGVGYVMRPGYDLPPLMLSVEEVEAVTIALCLLSRTGDKGFKAVAQSIKGKIAAVLPRERSPALDHRALQASGWGAAEPESVDLATVRGAIREERKLDILYRDEKGDATRRNIRPIAVIYYVEVIAIVGWCELRQDYRHFRADRIAACVPLDERFSGRGDAMRASWSAGRQPGAFEVLAQGSPGQTSGPLLSPAHDDA